MSDIVKYSAYKNMHEEEDLFVGKMLKGIFDTVDKVVKGSMKVASDAATGGVKAASDATEGIFPTTPGQEQDLSYLGYVNCMRKCQAKGTSWLGCQYGPCGV